MAKGKAARKIYRQVVSLRLLPAQVEELHALARSGQVTLTYIVERCLELGLEEIRGELTALADHGPELGS